MEAPSTVAMGSAVWVADEEDVLVSGTALIWASEFSVMDASLGLLYGTARSNLPRWYKVEAPDSSTWRLRSTSRALISPQAGRIISGAGAPLAALRRSPIAVSTPLAVFDLTAGAPVVARTVWAHPGALFNTAAKAGDSQGLAGTNVLVQNLGATQPAYIVFRLTPPQGDTTTSDANQRLSSLYLAVREATTSRIWIAGDVAGHARGHSTITSILVATTPINAVGFWMPANESGTGRAGGFQYWRIDLVWYHLSASRFLPLQGVGGGMEGYAFGGVSGAGSQLSGAGGGDYVIAL